MEKKDWQPPKLQSTEIVRRLPLVPLDKIVDSLDPGAVVDFSIADKMTKKAMRTYFENLGPTKKWQLGYTVIFMPNYSEIQLRCKDPSKSFKWKFMDKDLFHRTEGNATRDPKVYTYGVKKTENAARTVQQLLRIKDIFPALTEKLVVYTGALINEKVAKEIAKIKKVKAMYLEGKDSVVSKTFDVLFKNIKVLDRLDVHEFSGKKSLKTKKIAQIPYARLKLEYAPAPAKIFEAATQKKSFRLEKGPKDFCNSLIRCWLESERCDMDVLTIQICEYTCQNKGGLLDKLFDGLNFVKGTRICCNSDRDQPFTEWGCLLRILQLEGIEFHRKDGAILCLIYQSFFRGEEFTLFAEYPGRPSPMQAERMSYCGDQYAKLFDRIDPVDVYHLRRKNNRRVAEWFEENELLFDAAETARHNRFQQSDKFKDALEISKHLMATLEKNELKAEMTCFYQADGRKAYGHFELALNLNKRPRFRFF